MMSASWVHVDVLTGGEEQISTGVSHQACPWESSALTPQHWEQRKYWIQASDLIAHLMNMLQEQYEVTELLIDEHNGYYHVSKEDALRSYHRKAL
ncbi:hypothetical protein [Parasitella parasitica]|uniref:Uncharacterized protein n=1 Tax=Parasitella parasitica TaxID=35722 RepID=A0A0B7NB12_9FUNG|nr:hypothetical protein [Parasitella parasitica]